MPKMEFTYEVTCQMTLEHERGAKTSALVAANLAFEVKKPLDRSVYLDCKGLPRKEALKPITNTVLTALITHVRSCAARGWMKEGDHMNYISLTNYSQCT